MALPPARSRALHGPLFPPDLRPRRRLALVLLLVGLVLALTGVATFHPPSCSGGSPTTPASCSSWETAQWLMVAGALVAAGAFVYLGLMLQEERRRLLIGGTEQAPS